MVMFRRLNFIRLIKVNIAYTLFSFLLGLIIISSGGATQFKRADASPPLESKRSDYFNTLPRNIEPIIYKISIRTDPVTGILWGEVKMTFVVLEATKNISVNLLDLYVTTVSVRGPDGKKLEIHDTEEYEYDEYVDVNYDTEIYTVIMEEDLIKGNQYILTIAYEGFLSNDKTGFYWGYYYDENDKMEYFATSRFEPNFARKAFPCMDEPHFKTNFYIDLTVPKGYTALSNTDCIHTEDFEDLGDEWTLFIFDRTASMSTHTVAMVVAPFENISTSDQTFTIHGQRALIRSTWGKFALDNVEATVQYFMDYFEHTYAVDKLNLVGIPDEFYPFGTTNDWGLLITKESSIFWKETETLTNEIQVVMMTMFHEVAHQWIGSLVSPIAWEYLWLNEGFATFFQHYALEKLHPSWRMMDQFVVEILQPAMIMDSISEGTLLNSNPVKYYNELTHQPWKAYFKAASVVRMMYHFLTPEIFKKAIQLYISANVYGTVTPDSLFDAFQKAIGKDNAYHLRTNQSIKAIMCTWDQTRGFPLVKVTRDYKTGKVLLSQTKFLYFQYDDTTHLWMIPINYAFSSRISDFNVTTVDTWLTERVMEIPHAPTKGWMILNKYVQSYYRVDYDEINWMRLIEFLNSDEFEKIPAVNRAQLIDDSFNLARSGRLNYSIPFDISKYMKKEKDYIPWYTLFVNLKFIKEKMYPFPEYEHFKKYVRSLYENLYNRIGLKVNSWDSHSDKLLREILSTWMCSTGDERCTNLATRTFKDWLEGLVDMHPDLQTAFFCGYAAEGNFEEFDWLMSEYHTQPKYHENMRKRIVRGMGCTRKENLMRMFLIEVSVDRGLFDTDHKVEVFEALYSQSYAGLKYVLQFLMEMNPTLPENVDIETILTGITRFITTDELLFQLQNATKHIHRGTKHRLNVLEEAGKNLQWTKRHIDDLIKHIPKSKTNLICSNATFILIIYVMTMLF